MGASGAEPWDRDLVQAARRGDGQAFGLLVDRHLPSVYAVARRLLGSAVDAEDVSQETFLRAFEKLGMCNLDYSFRNWLLKIASNLAINRLRSRRREQRFHLRVAERQAQGGSQLEAHAEGQGQVVWQPWLDQLDLRQRTAIVLFHFHEMSYAEVAEVLEVPINSVRTLLHRGRRRLRELMTRRARPEDGAWTVAM